jgi:hypothetical protein
MTLLVSEKVRKESYSPFKLIQEEKIVDFLFHTKGQSIVIVNNHDFLTSIFALPSEKFYRKQNDVRKRITIVLITDPPVPSLFLLEALFKEVIVIPRDTSLPVNQIQEIIRSKNAENYVIGGKIDKRTHTVILVRGDLSKLAAPFSTFRPSGINVKPDFTKFSIEDSGQTLKFGDYEASVDAVLYEFDPPYRSEKRAELAEKDESFGACLRRLRVLKGLKQNDFPDLDEREVRRIECGEVAPRKSTVEKLARKLGVSVEEIRSY